MNQKELTKKFIMLSNGLKPFGFHDLNKINPALKGLAHPTPNYLFSFVFAFG